MYEQVSHSLLNAILDDLKPEIRRQDLRHFYTRLGANFYAIYSLFFNLYGHRDDFQQQMLHLVETMAEGYIDRSQELERVDIEREQDHNWFLSQKWVGVALYTNGFAENLGDLAEVDRGTRETGAVRRIHVKDALVDTGATTLALPTWMIAQLGLKKAYERQARSTRGIGPVPVYEAVRVTIQERFCTVDVMEVPDDVPVLVGQIPLEMLDLVVDPQARRLIGNPAHGGEHVLELY